METQMLRFFISNIYLEKYSLFLSELFIQIAKSHIFHQHYSHPSRKANSHIFRQQYSLFENKYSDFVTFFINTIFTHLWKLWKLWKTQMLRFSISIIPPTEESKFSEFSHQILAILKANSQICHIFYQQYLLFKTNAYFLYFHHLSNIINTHILHQHYLPQRQKLRFSISTIPTHLEQQILTFFISNISNILIFEDKRLLFVFYNARFIS
jgi:hypothetical protein